MLGFGHEFEIALLGHVEIDPHDAIIGQGREDVPLLDQAALLLSLAVDDAVEGGPDRGEVQFGQRQIRLGLGLGELGLEQFHLVLGNALLGGQSLGVRQFQSREFLLGDLGFPPCLVEDRLDLEHQVALSHHLALPDRDGHEIPTLKRADIDVSARVDLADVFLGNDDILRDRAGDHDLMLLVVGLLLIVLVKVRLIQADGSLFQWLDTRDDGVEGSVNPGGVERWDVHA